MPPSLAAHAVLARRSDFTRALTRWGRQHARAFPWRDGLPVWQALIVEVMLQRTRAEQVAPTFNRFRQRFPSLAALASVSEADLMALMEPLGLRWRARRLHLLVREIVRLNGEMPRDQSTLETLPGVGPYAAAATLSLHANRRAVLIDSNIVRVLCRVVGATCDAETRRRRWLRDLADALTPPRGHRAYNYALLDLAALVCLPRSPRCDECPILRWCVTGSGRT